jgi:hypothetical protein
MVRRCHFSSPFNLSLPAAAHSAQELKLNALFIVPQLYSFTVVVWALIHERHYT